MNKKLQQHLRLISDRKQVTPASAIALSDAPKAQRPCWHRLLAILLVVTLQLVPLKVTIDGVTGLHLGFNAAVAAPIADPAAPLQFRPAITQTTGAGLPVPVVNITAPNAAGASLNKYQQFNVDPVGLILNNSVVNGGSLLGGNVAANASLNGRPATLIINEVTSTGGAFMSALNGSVEVFGQKADIVIANPNGISCTGCSFINTPRITLTSGTPQFLTAPGGLLTGFDNGTALAFDVRGGRVQIGGAGANATGIEGTVGRLDIISETIGISAPIRAGSQINLISGRQSVAEAPSKQGTAGSDYAISSNGAANNAPAVASSQNGLAIDANAFGAMSAGQIKIIATTQGLGVRADGALAASANDLTISSNGDVKVAQTYARQNLSIAGAGSVTASNALAEQNLSLSAGRDLSTSGSLEARQNLTLKSGGSQIGSGSISALQSASLDAGGSIANSAAISAGDKFSASTGANLSLTGTTSANGAVSLVAGGSAVANEITTPATLSVDAGGDVSLSGKTTAGGAVAFSAGQNISVAGSATAMGDLSFDAKQGNISLGSGGDIVATNGALSVTAGGGLATAAAVSAAKNINITTGGATTLGGDLTAGESLHIAAGGAITAVGQISVNRGAILTGNNIALNSALSVNQDLTITAVGDLATRGEVTVGGNAIVAARNGTVDGALSVAGDLSVFTTQAFTSTRPLTVIGNASVRAGSAALGGDAQFGGNLDIATLGNTTLGDRTVVFGDVTVNAQGALTSGALAVRGNVDLLSRGDQLLAGDITVLGETRLVAMQGALTTQGKLLTNKSLAASAAGPIATGTLLVGENATLTSQSTINTNGDVSTGGNLSLDAATELALTGKTAITGSADLKARAGNLSIANEFTTASLTAQAGQDLRANATIEVRGDAALTANGNIGNSVTLVAAGNVMQSAGGDIVNGGAVVALGDLTASAGGSASFSGSTAVVKDFAISARQNVTLAGTTQVLGATALTAGNGDLRTQGETVLGGSLIGTAGRDVMIAGNTDVRGATQLTAGRSAQIAGTAVFNANLNVQGQAIALKDRLTVLGNGQFAATQGDLIQDATLKVVGDLGLVAAGDIAGSGTVSANGAAGFSAQRRIDLAGPLVVGKDLTVAGVQGVVLGQVTVIDNALLTAANGAIALNGATLTGGNLTAIAKTDATINSSVKSLAIIALTAQQGNFVANAGLATILFT